MNFLQLIEQKRDGGELSPEAIAAAVTDAGTGIDDLNADIHASADYRRAMIPVFTKRAVEQAVARA